jgi:protein-tyrosine-phosphatase
MPNILIVCTANICRSPMAQAMLQHEFARRGMHGWQVGSAGTWAMGGGSPAAEHGVTLMRARGLDTSTHRSREISADLLASADLVLTMEHGHKEALSAEFPTLAGRIYLLSEMSGFPRDIPDPYGEPIEQYRETMRELDDYIQRGFSRIVELAGGSHVAG